MILESMLWLSQNVWPLLLYLTGKTSFPKALKPEEEGPLVAALSAGDRAAAEALISHNLRLVAHIAKKYAGSGVDQDDLVSIGSIGLIKAVHTFRPEAGRLTSYASRCIENEIRMFLRANRKNANNILLGEPLGTDKEGNEIQLLDILGTDSNAVPDAAETAIEGTRALALLGTVLTKRERQVVEMRCGLVDGEPRAQREVAAALGISRSYVSRIEKKALEKLRAALG